MSTLATELSFALPHLAEYVIPRRWFRGKARAVKGASITTSIPLGVPERSAWFAVVRVSFTDGGFEDYALPLVSVSAQVAEGIRVAHPHLVVCELPGGGALVDALGDAQVLEALFAMMAAGAVRAHDGVELRFRPLEDGLGRSLAKPRALEAEQSNTSIAFGDEFILKVIRKLDDGISPDLDMGTFLTRAGYQHAPKVAGALELARPGGQPATAGVVHHFVVNRGDAWAFFLARLAGASRSAKSDALGEDRLLLRRLASRVAEMHVLLASRPDLPAFAPEPVSHEERARLAEAVRISLDKALLGLASRRAGLPPEAISALDVVVRRASDLAARLDAFVTLPAQVWKTRLHGDLHLGQVLVTGDDFVLIDFEGEPARPLAERKAKRSPLADLAGLLRSIHYAAITAARANRSGGGDPAYFARWHKEAAREILVAYFDRVSGSAPGQDSRTTLDFYLLEKCIYELHYELNNRPDWIAIPLAGLASLIEETDAV